MMLSHQQHMRWNWRFESWQGKIKGTHRESKSVLIFPMPESVRKKEGQNWNFILRVGFQKWIWRDDLKMEYRNAKKMR